MKRLLLFIYLLFASIYLGAQCPGVPALSVTGTSSSSTCESNGSITITPTGGNPFNDTNGNPIYQNEIIAGPIIQPSQSGTVFNALSSGTYTVQVTDACGDVVTTSITVGGSYMTLDLDFEFTNVSCQGGNTGSICGIPSDGLAPYTEYRLYDASTNPPTLITSGLDSCFTGLSAGMYQIQVWDQCANFQTRDVTIITETYSNSGTFASYSFIQDCNTACVELYAYAPNGQYPGAFPIAWEVTSSDVAVIVGTTGTLDSGMDIDTFCYTPAFVPGAYVITYTDFCGSTWSVADTLVPYVVLTGSSDYSCTRGTYYTVNYEGSPPGFPVPGYCDSMIYEITSAPPGAPVFPPQSSPTFDSLVAGNYCFRMTDCCGNVHDFCDGISEPRWNYYYFDKYITCVPGEVGFKNYYTTNGGPAPNNAYLTYILTSAPAGYSNPVPDTMGYLDLVTGPPGNYCFTMENCGFSVDTCLNITNVLVFDYNLNVTTGCVTGNNIEIDIVNTNLPTSYYGVDFIQVLPTYNVIQSNGSNTAFNNLTSGTYVIDLYNIRADTCSIVYDTIVIEDYIVPGLETVWGIECDNGTGLITAVGTSGTPPYTYELFMGPVTRPIQSSPSFPGLPIGTYSIRIYDSCTNSSITSVSIEPFEPVIEGSTDPVCEGDSAIIMVDSVAIANYQWNGPNGFSSTNATLVWPNATTAIAGVYTLNVTINNPDASTCIDQTLMFNLQVIDCNSCEKLITRTSIKPVTCGGTDDGAASVIGLNGAAPYTYVWDAAAGGQTTSSANNLAAGIYQVSVTDSNGCCAIASIVVGEAPCDPCLEAEAGTLDICAEIQANPSSPLGTLDCDNGGVDNETECAQGEDPTDPADDCNAAIGAGLDICAVLTANPGSPLARADCDNGGVDNATECAQGADPTNPADDCQAALDAGTICQIIGYNPTHPLAVEDCDGGGIDNYTECSNGGDPSDPVDDCQVAMTAETDICALIQADPANPIANLDCDGGGVDNATECVNGEDPLDPEDDCQAAIDAGVNICIIISNNPNSPIAMQDCDGGGVDNETECTNGEDPANPADDCDAAIDAGTICEIIGYDPTHPLAKLDCDNGGIDNETECSNGGDPADSADDCQVAVTAGTDICTIIAGGGHPWATLDCDNGGIDNETECANGDDPNDPSDDNVCPPVDPCFLAQVGDIDICAVLTGDPNDPIGTLDCDGDGVSNADECTDGTDPLDPCLFDDTSITLPITADQSDCENLCPDLSPVVTILPGNIAGTASVGMAVEVFELNNIVTDGSAIIVRVPSDPRYTFTWDPLLTTIALTPVNNSDWNFLGNNGIVYTLQYTGGTIAGLGKSAFGFDGVYDPQSTDGQTTFTASIVPTSGGECNFLNDTDSERLVYFE